MKPNILILDELTASQADAHYSEIMDFLDPLNKVHGDTFITHGMRLVIEYTDRSFGFCRG